MENSPVIKDIWDEVQYDSFCASIPMSYSDWLRLIADCIDGISELNPYPLDEKTANKKILERLH